jgi:hypothetical protein
MSTLNPIRLATSLYCLTVLLLDNGLQDDVKWTVQQQQLSVTIAAGVAEGVAQRKGQCWL